MEQTRKTLPRAILARVLETLGAFRVVAITGPRQAGKTTLAREVLEHTEGAYLTLDDPGTLAALESDPRTVLDREGTLVIDEFQRGGEALLRQVKRAVDEDGRKGRFLLTGSTRFLSVPTLAESLAGRVALVDLWPLSQGELARRSDRFIDRLFGSSTALRAGRGEALSRGEVLGRVCLGGFPEVQGLTAAMRSRWYASYVRTVTQRDIPEIHGVRQPNALSILLDLLAARTAQELSVASIAKDARRPEVTVAAHLSLLETVHLWFQVPAWSRNLTKKVVRHAKGHILDSGLAAHLLRVDPQSLGTPGSPALGPLLETFVAGELARQVGWADTEVDLRHFRDRDGLEVDLVLEARDGRVALIEVKASRTVEPRDFAGIDRLATKIGKRFVHGVVLYLGLDMLPFGPGRTALPVPALWAP